MAREDAFKVEGVIVEAFPNVTYRVALSNGHQLLGFVTGKARSANGATLKSPRVQRDRAN